MSTVSIQTESIYASKPWLRHYDFWVPQSATFPRQSLYQVLALAKMRYADRPATVFMGARLTYAEIKDRADRLAAALAELGIAKGDRVGIMLPNSPQYMVAFFALMRLGAIVTNINPTYTPREVENTAKDSGMRTVITFDQAAPMIIGLSETTAIQTVVSTSLAAWSARPEDAKPAPPGTLSFEKLIEDAAAVRLPAVTIDPEQDVAVLQYTGGTTGAPKGAMLTHYNLYANMLQNVFWNSYFTEKGMERILTVIPAYHIYGLNVMMLVGPWNGAMQILVPKFDIEGLIQAFRLYRPTSFPAVPTLYIALLNHPEAQTCGFENVKQFVSGSAPCPVEVIEKFESLSGGKLQEGFGLTEASPTTHSTPMLAKRKPGSIGLPLTGTECRIVDVETGENEMPVGEEGELCIRGPQVMKGYWNRPEETAAALRDGWLYTGDIARMDEDGYFYIVQRKKDMIIVNGLKVYPNEIEEVLFTHPAVMEAAAIGIAHPYRGEVVKAFVVLRAGQNASAEELMEHCRGRMAKFKLPAEIEFANALPKSAIGKVLRRSLREMEAQRHSK